MINDREYISAVNLPSGSKKYIKDEEVREVVQGIDSTANNYIEMKSGIREYLSTTVPIGNIPIGSIGMGFDEGVWTYKSGTKVSEGERTWNLLNLNRTYSNSFTTDTTKWMNGAASTNLVGTTYAETEIIGDIIKVTSKLSGYGANFLIEASPNTTYTVSFEADKESSGSWAGISDRDINGTAISNIVAKSKSATFTTHDNCAFLNVCFRFPPADGTVTFSKIMLNVGSTPLPYEPYGKQKISFYANGQSLTDYTIYGATGGVGDATANEFTGDISQFDNQGGTGRSYEYFKLTGDYTITLTCKGDCTVPTGIILGLNADGGAPTDGYTGLVAQRGNYTQGQVITGKTSDNGYQYVYIYGGSNTLEWVVDHFDIMLNKGNTALPYEPYGYKIPVICGGQTTNIYLDSPLGANDSIDYTTSQTAIPTVDGANSLICNTTVQPSKVSLTYTGWHSELDEVFESIDNKEDALTPAQLAAVNSGITSTDVAQIETNKNNISSIQQEQIVQNADIATLRLALDAKIYGIRIDKQDVNPDTRVTYLYDAVGMTPAYMDFNSGTFNYGSWADIWFVRNNRPVALKFDGTVDYELDHTDFTKKLDGTTSDVSDPDYGGNFMSEMPTVYIKRWEDSRYNYIAFSDKQVNSDFLAQAHTNANGTVNSAIYLPMFKGWKDSNNKLRSLMGTYPTGNTTGTNEVTYASNNGAGWQIWDKAKIDLIMDLIMLITKSTNCRAKIGNGDCNTYNSSDANYGKMKSGYETDGTTRSTNAQFYGSEGTEVTNYGKHHMIAFYIEDLWGNRWDRCLGFNLVDNIYKIKMVAPYTLDSDSSYETLTVSPPSSTEGWLKNVSSANAYGDVPTEVDASNTTGFANYFYKNASGYRVSLFGGGCNRGLRVGRFWYLNYGSGVSDWNFGGSPCYNSPS